MPALLLFSLGGLWLLLWRRPWRLAGLLGLAGGVALYGVSRPPDLWLSETGTTMAVRAPDGRLAFSPGSGERVIRETWVRLSGGGKTPLPWYQVPQAGMTCGQASCRASVRGRDILFQRRAVAPSCPSADLVVGDIGSLPCPAQTIGTPALQQGGARVLWLGADGLEEHDVARWQGCRPWSPCPVPRQVAAGEGDQALGSDRSPK
jgi:competence protein ComEC